MTDEPRICNGCGAALKEFEQFYCEDCDYPELDDLEEQLNAE